MHRYSIITLLFVTCLSAGVQAEPLAPLLKRRVANDAQFKRAIVSRLQWERCKIPLALDLQASSALAAQRLLDAREVIGCGLPKQHRLGIDLPKRFPGSPFKVKLEYVDGSTLITVDAQRFALLDHFYSFFTDHVWFASIGNTDRKLAADTIDQLHRHLGSFSLTGGIRQAEVDALLHALE